MSIGKGVKDTTHVEVATVALRNLYPAGKRKWGMLITVTDDPISANNTTYMLVNGLVNNSKNDNSNWQRFSSFLAGEASEVQIARWDFTTDFESWNDYFPVLGGGVPWNWVASYGGSLKLITSNSILPRQLLQLNPGFPQNAFKMRFLIAVLNNNCTGLKLSAIIQNNSSVNIYNQQISNSFDGTEQTFELDITDPVVWTDGVNLLIKPEATAFGAGTQIYVSEIEIFTVGSPLGVVQDLQDVIAENPDANGQEILNLADPTTPQSADTKAARNAAISAGCVTPLDTELSTVGNVGPEESNIYVKTIPANTLQVDNRAIYGRVAGTLSNSDNYKRIKVKLDGAVFFDTTNFTCFEDNAKFILDFELIRVDQTHLKCFGRLVTNIGGVHYADFTAIIKDLTTDLDLQVSAQATADNEVVCEMVKIFVEPQ